MAPKVVVITGCSTGIGLETAVLLANEKENRFKVFATMRNLAKKEKLQEAAGATLDKTLFIRQLDVTEEQSIVEFIDRTEKEEGGVNILINNAEIGQVGVVEKVPMSQIRAIYETNVFGLIRLTQTVIPGMKARRCGHIINVSSFAGLYGYPFCDIYVSSKFAVEGFSESIAPVLKKFNISAIEPGPVQTKFTSNIKSNEKNAYPDGQVDLGVDDLTVQLHKTNFKNSRERLSNVLLTSGDIAVVIRDAILSDNPHLHYPTSDAMTKYVATKYVDPTGDSAVKFLTDMQLKE